MEGKESLGHYLHTQRVEPFVVASKTIGITGENKKGLYIPPGFAHGFCVLSEEAEFFYKCSDFYSPEHERCIRWNDPDLAIHWPIENPVVSEKDANAPLFKDAELPY